MASVQRIFGEGPIEGSNHIKLQTAGGPDSNCKARGKVKQHCKFYCVHDVEILA
jgi:hypothetical protein